MLAEAIDNHSVSPQALLDGIASGDKTSEQKLVNNYWRGLLFVLNRRA